MLPDIRVPSSYPKAFHWQNAPCANVKLSICVPCDVNAVTPEASWTFDAVAERHEKRPPSLIEMSVAVPPLLQAKVPPDFTAIEPAMPADETTIAALLDTIALLAVVPERQLTVHPLIVKSVNFTPALAETYAPLETLNPLALAPLNTTILPAALKIPPCIFAPL